MSQVVKKLRLFVASPGDVGAERAHLQEVVGELNRSDGNLNNYVLELVRWEQHAHPSMGRPQGIVNQQLGSYDIFIGIMWKRFGTPTGVADSGTEEEFRRAYALWQQDQTLPILFYFCTQPFYPATAEEVAQMARVVRFRSELNSLGLTWAYEDADAFPALVREHLVRVIQRLLDRDADPEVEPDALPLPKHFETSGLTEHDDPAARCSVALAFGKKISPVNSIDMHSRFRQALVAALVSRERLTADAVVPIPHAGIFLASCWSELRPESLWLAFGHAKYGSSMFRMPQDQSRRTEHARTKVGQILEQGHARRIFLIDEAVLSGTTLKLAIQSLRSHGVEKIYVRTIVPPLIKKCPYDVTTYEPGHGFDIGWHDHPEDRARVAAALGADDYACLRTDTILDLGAPRSLCVECLAPS